MDKIGVGIFYSLLAGLFITLQGVFNTRVSDRIGLWETTVVVHAVGLLFGLFMTFLIGQGNFKEISGVNKLYLVGGAMGVMIVYSVMMGITALGASFSIGVVVITQIIFAALVDNFGLFGSPIISFNLTKFIGVFIMILGIVVFQWKA